MATAPTTSKEDVRAKLAVGRNEVIHSLAITPISVTRLTPGHAIESCLAGIT